MTVASGSATAQTSGSQLNITTSQTAFLNWQSFNIAAGERTVFSQPSANSIVFNQIGNQSASQIYGSLQANGIVVLLNSSGFYFGPNSFVSAAGLVVSTASFAPPQNAGGAWVFNGPPPLASIVNYGQIKIGHGGDCFFIGDKIENHGDIIAPGGSIQFVAGQTVTLSERPDGRGMSMAVTLPQGSVDNYGNVIADGGTIALNAKVVNQNGFIQANSVRNKNGVIELIASDELNLGADSKISANGDASFGGSAGGSITLKSGNVFNDANGSEISAAGGGNGGNGGDVEISAPKMSAVNSKIDGMAQAGFKGGKLLLDPDYIVLDQSGSDSPTQNGSTGTVDVNDAPSGTLFFDVNSRFTGLSDITLQAAYDILFADGTTWNLSDSTGQSSGQLTLEAGRNIIFGNTTGLKDSGNWSVSLFAGVTDFAQKIVSPGAGSIYFNAFDPNNFTDASDSSGYLQLGSGSINLLAGQDIIVGLGRVITTGGGSISAHALAGNIDTGGYAQGYVFQTGNSAAEGYYIDPERYVGGISTVAGGDVNLTAGGNIQSILPGRDGYYYDGDFTPARGNSDVVTAGAGAYGVADSQIGNVNIIAGGNVTGHYLVANGTGKIFAGVQMDADGNPMTSGVDYLLGGNGSAGTDQSSPNLALSLIKGGWNVTAAHNIILQEVRNPNGMFNTLGRNNGSFHAFDYSEDAFVRLNAGNLVQLGGKESLLPRLTVSDGLKPPMLFPGILNIIAGAGGVVLTGDSTYNKLILFPSKLGSLTILTTGGGSLVGNLPAIGGTPQIFNLIMSDSGRTQYNPRSSANDFFGLSDHATTPVHLGHENDFTFDISGDMNSVFVAAPEAAEINVHGDMNNSRFQGMNLSAADKTYINVTGDINNRGAFTTVDLSSIAGASVGDLALLGRAISSEGDPSSSTLLASFLYNPATHLLTYQNISGKSLATVLQLLQHLTVQVYVNDVPQWKNPPFNTDPLTEVVSVLNPAAANALLAKYNSLGTPPSGAFGYAIGGGGEFHINAHNLDLGTTAGIQSWGVGLYNVAGKYPLANLFNTGSKIVVDLTGDLNMFSTAIASFNGGDIYVNAAGNVNVGSSDFNVTSLGARGIFATGRGNVSVYAGHDVNVEGSRIAVYDTRPLSAANSVIPGGSVTVVSREGNVNVGSGGSGFVVVNSFFTDPLTHLVTSQTPTIPGTGILQTSFNLTGNVLVEALMGNVVVGAGGVSQLLFKGNKTELDTDGMKVLLKLALEGSDKEASKFQNFLNGINPAAHVPIIDVYAGYGLQQLNSAQQPILDAFGNPVVNAQNIESGTLVQSAADKNIDASGSGIVGAGTANLKASGGITGNIFSLGDVNLDANQNINVVVFGLGNVSVASANGTVSGTIIGVGGVSASGSSIDASLESNGSISGETSGDKGFAASATAGNVAAAAANDDTASVTKKSNETDDELNKKKKGIALAQKVSRVTVLLPAKN